MNSVELVKSICKERKIPISKLEMDCGFSNGYVRKLKEGKFPSDRLLKISEYLDLPLTYLATGENEITKCYECGFEYDTSSSEECKEHEKEHRVYIAAKKKHNFLIPYALIENSINQNLNMARNSSLLEDATNYWIEAFKGYFSRSLNGCGYNVLHPEFESYVAMMLHQIHTKNRIGNDSIYNKLVSMFGTLPGMDNATSYWKPDNQKQENNLIMQYYDKLNDIGRHEATKRVMELTEVPRYLKEDTTYVNAAHADDYAGAPEELKQLEEDIMDDENF